MSNFFLKRSGGENVENILVDHFPIKFIDLEEFEIYDKEFYSEKLKKTFEKY